MPRRSKAGNLPCRLDLVCLGLVEDGVLFGNAECLIRPRKDFARIMNVEALVVLCGQF